MRQKRKRLLFFGWTARQCRLSTAALLQDAESGAASRKGRGPSHDSTCWGHLEENLVFPKAPKPTSFEVLEE
jgi:hypothetical protein